MKRNFYLFNAGICLLSVFFCLTPVFSSDGNEITIGINVPLTGAYEDQGKDELKAYELAIDILNNEKSGILGKKIKYIVKDTQTKPDVARKNAEELIDAGAIMVTGGSHSGVAIAQSEVCQKRNIIFMAGLTHSNDTTGKDGHRHCFRWYNNGHQTAKAMASVLLEQLGNSATYAMIYADYTWGITLKDSMKKVVQDAGCKVLLEEPTKVGQTDYKDALKKAEASNATALVLVHFGKDMINVLKQAYEMGLKKKMKTVVPLMELHMATGAGAEVMEGVITSMCWYPGLEKMYEGSKYFVENFRKKYNKPPGNAAATAWVDIFQYASAVERAGSFDHEEVILALEDHDFELLVGPEYWRGWDHQGIHPTYVAIGKPPAHCKDEWDLFYILGAASGDDVARTQEENPVTLEPLSFEE